MSSDRSNNPPRPSKPSLASTRTARTPIAPRIAAANATASPKSLASQPSPSVRSEPPIARVQVATPVNNALASGNVTPRSSARSSRPGSANASPITSTRPKSMVVAAGSDKGLGSEIGDRAQTSRPRSIINENGRAQSPLVKTPGFFDLSPPPEDKSFESRFFHASDAPSQDSAQLKKPEPPKKAQFFHADGRQDVDSTSPTASSPVLSAVSEQRSNGPWIRPENALPLAKSPPLMSPALSALSATSPFFASASPPSLGQIRSPSPSKENIHLSYRKGASQIIGTRPTPVSRSTASSIDNIQRARVPEGKSSAEPPNTGNGQHQKSTSLSSISSGGPPPFRRQSIAVGDVNPQPSPLAQELHSSPFARAAKPPNDLPSIDTSLDSPGILSRTESSMSPTKQVPDLAADARRERKVLDLEISNSSLLAINASLEREVRRQRAELKSFRRLSRAGRFSFAPGDRMRAPSDDLGALAEEDEEEDGDEIFGLHSGSMDQDDLSDDDEESLVSSGEPLSTSAQDRLAKDERRLQIDLEKHRELLVQSQAMNQSIKRCMYATEDMIREGKKALEYQVRVSDVKLGGRVLSNDGHVHREIEVEDESAQPDTVDPAKAFLDTWAHVGASNLEGSEGGDRDSGIEVDRPHGQSLPLMTKSGGAADAMRPTSLHDLGKFGSFS